VDMKIYENLRKMGEQWLIAVFLLFSLFEAILAALSILGLPGAISVNRVLLFSIPALIGGAALYLIIWNKKHHDRIPAWIRNINTLPGIRRIAIFSLWLGAFIFWAAAFLPVSDLGRWGAIYVRFQPILLLAFLLFVQMLTVWLFFTSDGHFDRQSSNDRQAFIAGIILAVFFTVVIVIIYFTGWGIGIGTQYWGKVGVPILHWQIGLSLVIMLLGTYLAGKIRRQFIQNWQFDLIVFVVLWAGAFLVWQAIPTDISRFTTRIYPPNYVSYPYSDAGDYVLSAESILLGNGFQFGFIDKSVHLTFLAMLRLMAGADFGKMILLQVALLAVIPGLIYLITSRISNRPSGVLAGLVVLFMQSNSLSAINRIQVSNVKMMMSEPLTGLILMLVCLAVVSWWRKPGANWGYPALAGALLGLAGLVRLNALVIAPFIGGIWLISFGLRKRQTWIALLIFTVFCILPLVPWMARNQIKLGDPLAFITSKTSGVIMKNRFKPVMNDQMEGAGEKGISGLIQPMIHTGMHNLVAVSLVLPASWTHNGLDNTIRQPYWDLEWDGKFTPGGQVIFGLSLLLVAAGFSASWRKKRVIPLVLLMILFAYLLSNTYSLVSGGRYIVPVDWVLPVFYCIGLTEIASKLLKISANRFLVGTENTQIERSGNWYSPKTLVIIVLLAACLPAGLSLFMPKKFAQAIPNADLKVLQTAFTASNAPFTFADIENFAKTDGAEVLRGRAMFPRWMQSGIGDTEGPGTAFSALPFDHLSFSMLSHLDDPFNVVLPINEQVDFLPNASDVIVVGCKGEAFFDAAAVFVLSSENILYTRPDINQLACPFPQP